MSSPTRTCVASPPATTAPDRPNYAALFVLATCSFIYVTAEMLPVGLLPQISADLNVTEAQVGLLLTSYAAVAAVTTIPMTALTMRFTRNRLLAGTLAVFVVAQLVAALAPSLTVLSITRIFSAAAHGVFWAIVAPIAARLAPPGQTGKATSIVFTGSAVAMVLGAPIGTVIGQASSWRVAVVTVGVVGALSLLCILLIVPKLPVLPRDAAKTTVGQLAAAGRQIRSRATLPGCLITLTAVIGQFAAYTYVAPLVRRDAGLDGRALAVLLLAFGVAGVVGNVLAGRFIDRRPDLVMMAIFGTMSVSMAVLVGTPGAVVTVIAVVFWGLSSSPMSMSLQAAVIRRAPRTQDAAASVQVVAFQIGIGGGALIGERLYGHGFLVLLPVFGAVMTALALLLAFRAKETFPRHPVPHVDATH
ncbi:MFS transporter [Kineosporia succinea]|uniref:MFS family arabinose efflux permease n=1 Tax=Kineosporia succinea TaxID=84632 RepID=A0ABT9NWQ8_9ACTN|nr:MFS transporter [Kineosporia succinea]MDP9824863.1 putative MFS family arabinose efflux permease [Kineosporia succinea]